MSASKAHPQNIDRVLGHAPGTIITDEVVEYRVVRAAQKVMLHHYEKHGLEGIHNLMGLVDNCTVPDFFEEPAYQERYLGTALMEEELTDLARQHLGGDESYRAQVFNRVTAGTITVTQALVPPNSVVPYVVPPYPGVGGHGHPSVPRAVELARSRWIEVTSPEELGSLLAEEQNVPLVIVCSAYRGVLKEEELQKICEVSHARGVPVYVDDASGARTRTAFYEQLPAGDLGADLVMTSCEKAAFYGPRAGLLVGRTDLMDQVGAKANMMGTEGRPAIVAAALRTLQQYTPEHGRELFSQWLNRHHDLWELAKPILGESLQYGAYDGIYLSLNDFTELVLSRAGLGETDLAPVDLSVTHAMLMLRGFGFLCVASLHYPGASKMMSVKVNSLREGDDISNEGILEGVDASIDALARVISDRSSLEKVLFGPPE